ncbi:hypothetical protein DFH27DRAFT_572932 [Peziza echinospora]|nr:hypothetical protein DFH27DRAFT_572932 [Peziza echinospora]
MSSSHLTPFPLLVLISASISTSAGALSHLLPHSSKYMFARHYRILGYYGHYIPMELFRINFSENVALKDLCCQRERGRKSYDLFLGGDGMVHPLVGKFFRGPNGASMRPMGQNYSR